MLQHIELSNSRSLCVALLLVFTLGQPAAGEWVNVTGSLADKPARCGGVYCLAAVPKQNKVVIGICGAGLYRHHATTELPGNRWGPRSTGWTRRPSCSTRTTPTSSGNAAFTAG